MTGEKDDKYYQSGKLVRAGSDEKYQVVKHVNETDAVGYDKLDDADEFITELGADVKYHVKHCCYTGKSGCSWRKQEA